VKLLAIETSTRNLGSALWDEGAPVASFSMVAGARHAEVLLPAIDWLCRQANWSVGDIEAVAVDNGPGLFTGLRVGLATAQAIAAARGLPAVGVSSLEALAHRQRRRPGLLAAVVDARRGEVFWSLYRSDGQDLEQLRNPAVASPEALAGELATVARQHNEEREATSGGTCRVLAVGDGAWRYRDLLAEAGSEVAGPADMWPSADTVAELGWERLAEAGAPTGPLLPAYLRHADVRIGWEQVSGRVGAPGGAAQ
jgi:tRNA threonylcarbamoyladenosine biosynthesis protein TsaB